VFDYLLNAERDVVVSAIYRALLRLFESKGGSKARVPERLSSRISSRNEVEKLAARILFDIMEVEQRDLASLPPEEVRRYTTCLSRVASSRYTADKTVRSEALRFLKEIDHPLPSNKDVAVH
jgi:hypothetical protein